jgi:scyllo-inositol 2-dehydrogenase (NADP+)
MAEKVRVGLVGFGKSAKVFHVPFLLTMKEFEVTAVLERHANEAEKVFPDITTVRTIDELVQRNDVDLVVITTPNDTHFPYAAKALRAGKHVVVEKPFTNTLEEGRELIEIGKQSGKVFSVYQNRRYVSDFLTMKELVRENMLGDVHEFNATYDRYRPDPVPGSWREADIPGSGILYDLGPHLLDQVMNLFGKPESITADIKKQRWFSKVDDYFNIWLNFGFLKVILHSGMLVREQGPRYMIQGVKGSFIKYGEDPQEALLKEGHLPVGEDWGKEPESDAGILHTELNGEVIRKPVPSKKGNYGDYYRNIYNSIIHHSPVSEKPEDGYNTIRLIQLAFESSEKKKTLECTGLL